MSPPPPDAAPSAPTGSATNSTIVAAAILLSRLSGLVREALFSQVFGLSLHADAFRAALRMPNLLQNLLGEGTLSASFIPVYAELIGQGRREEAGRVAGAVFGLLAVLAGVLALAGVALAPIGVTLLFPGFTGETRDLTIALVRILFPMTGVLVLSAWALGILNSHRSFFLPYFAPVVWNGSIVAAMVVGAYGFALDAYALAVATGWGALVGGVLQLAVQLPKVRRLEPQLRPSLDRSLAGVREVLRNAGPAVLGRGVVQVSGYLDLMLASALATSAVASLGAAQTIYLLPVSLFGMSVAAAELPELARERAGAIEALRDRTNAAIERVAFYVVPSCAAFLAIGDAIVGALYQRGKFGPDATTVVWLVLCGYSVGLLASTTTRLFSSAFFALRDTKTPARIATARVLVSAILGFGLMMQLEEVRFDQFGFALPAGALSHLHVGAFKLGAVGLAVGAGLAAWVEWVLLRRALSAKVGPIGGRPGVWLRLIAAASVAAAVGLGARALVPTVHPIVDGLVACGAFGVTYLGVAAALGLGEAAALVGRVARRVRR